MSRPVVEIPVPDVVEIAGDLHPKTAAAHQAVLEWLSQDYDIKDCNQDPTHPHDAHYCSLKETVFQRMLVCNHCGKLGDTRGSRCHGHTCEHCGGLLYQEYLPGVVIRFEFWDSKPGFESRTVSLRIRRYDLEAEEVVFEPEQVVSGFYSEVRPEQFTTMMEAHQDDYRITKDGGWAFYYPSRSRGQADDRLRINTHEVGRPENDERRSFYKFVGVYKEEIYPAIWGFGDDNIPVPRSYMVYPTYKQLPLPHTPKLSARLISLARQVSRCDYYYQDGRQAFDNGHLAWIRTAVEHLTDLDLQRFDQFLRRCPKDGPGFIRSLAVFVTRETGVEQLVENQPNIWNAVTALTKVASGQGITSGEAEACQHALSDRGVQRELFDLYSGLSKYRG